MYITDKKVAAGRRPERRRPGSSAGTSRRWMVDQYPDITDWNNLNKYADLFKTSESGDKGQFLGSDPTFVTNDEALITNLEPQLQGRLLRQRGGDDHRLPAGRQEQEAADRLLLRPAVAADEIKLVQVKLPAYTDGCDADPKKVACDYPPYTLNKIVRNEVQRHRRAALRR